MAQTESRAQSYSRSVRFNLKKLGENPYIILTGIFIALIGGIPGGCGIYKDYFAKPNLLYISQTIMTGDITTPNSPPETCVFLMCGLINDGNRSLYPNSFDMRIKHLGKVYTGNRYFVKDFTKIASIVEKYKLDTNLTDFGFLKEFEKDQPVYGGLYFRFPGLTTKELKDPANTVTLICLDIYKKAYEIDLSKDVGLTTSAEVKPNMFYPKINFGRK